MAGRSKRDFWRTGVLNDAAYLQYYNRLVELSVSMWDWQNLPDTVDPRFLELILFSQGQAVFFMDEVLGYLALKNSMSGQFDLYDVPINRRAYAANGYQKTLNNKDSVLIWNNYLHTNSMLDVSNFARRLFEIDRTIEVNVRAQKTPVLIVCDENQRLTMENLYRQYSGDQPVIFGDKSLSTDTIKSLSTGAPFVCDKLYNLKTNIWNEALTYLGISNVNTQKRERMIVDEVASTNGGVMASRYSRLSARQEACKQINRMFGLDIWCEYKNDYQIVTDEETNQDNLFEEVGGNG